MLNGLLIIWLRVHPLIVTLGMGAILQGVVAALFAGTGGSVPPSFDFLAYGKVRGIPIGAIFIAGRCSRWSALFLRYTRSAATSMPSATTRSARG